MPYVHHKLDLSRKKPVINLESKIWHLYTQRKLRTQCAVYLQQMLFMINHIRAITLHRKVTLCSLTPSSVNRIC